ncbi:hypothetical protein BU16DRAFT_471637 [Lophium mytilinum]|uniref:DUF1308 domain-containing protein n=1 Tax=Lophium mytilinum TaxID=390894 RepID=A0A6A6QBA0_9PEZI|nr:hypothetical protein BU16DRAFT_471637 [Lophium mytilinum]
MAVVSEASKSENDQAADQPSEDTDAPENPAELEAIAQDLLSRAKSLLSEVETWIEAVHQKKLSTGQRAVEYRTIRNDIEAEIGFLQKLATMDLSQEKARHYIVSSNLMYFEAMWAAAKRSSGLLAFRKNLFHSRPAERRRGVEQKGATPSRVRGDDKAFALVDIIACDGLEWIKISTMSEKRLLFDLAKLGWQNDAFSDDEDEDMNDQPNRLDEDDDDEVSLVKTARDLAKGAPKSRVMGKIPTVRFVLPRIHSGKIKEIDSVIQKMRATGAIVECGNDLELPPPMEVALPRLLVDRSTNFTETLNIDCTILLAIISDISHADVPIQDWYPPAVKSQIVSEAKERLLPTQFYPILNGRSMVCTEEAALQMKEIAAIIGTETEKQRALVLFGEISHQSGEDLVMAWSKLSAYSTPADFLLPIRVLPKDVPDARISPAAAAVASELTPINSSVFLFGWMAGLTTLTSNRTTVKQIDRIVDDVGLENWDSGPLLWVSEEARSLIAKQGRRKA